MPLSRVTRSSLAALSTKNLVLLLAWVISELAARFSLRTAEYDVISMEVGESGPGTPPVPTNTPDAQP